MAVVAEAIVARLADTPEVVALIDTRISPMTADQGTAFPYVTYQTISEDPLNHSTGDTGTHHTMIQLDSALDVQIATRIRKEIENHIDREIVILQEDIFTFSTDDIKADYLKKQAQYNALVNLKMMIDQLIFNTSKGGVDD